MGRDPHPRPIPTLRHVKGETYVFTLYTTFKFLHVAAVIVWLGSTGTLGCSTCVCWAGQSAATCCPCCNWGWRWEHSSPSPRCSPWLRAL